MVYINKLPSPTGIVPEFDHAKAKYPFKQYTDEELLNFVVDFLDGNLHHRRAIQPVNFQHYTVGNLKYHFCSSDLKREPLFFLHHWCGKPYTGCFDYSQRSAYKDVRACEWHEDDKVTVNYHDSLEMQIFKKTYKLYDTLVTTQSSAQDAHERQLEVGPRTISRDLTSYRLVEWTLPAHAYESLEEDAHVLDSYKKRNWSVVKLYKK